VCVVSCPLLLLAGVVQLLHSNLLGSSESERLTQLYEGGLSIHSTLLPTDQANAQAAAVSKISIKDPVANDVVSIQPGTGDVLAMAQNRDYGLNTSENQSEVNYATSSARWDLHSRYSP